MSWRKSSEVGWVRRRGRGGEAGFCLLRGVSRKTEGDCPVERKSALQQSSGPTETV